MTISNTETREFVFTLTNIIPLFLLFVLLLYLNLFYQVCLLILMWFSDFFSIIVRSMGHWHVRQSRIWWQEAPSGWFLLMLASRYTPEPPTPRWGENALSICLWRRQGVLFVGKIVSFWLTVILHLYFTSQIQFFC